MKINKQKIRFQVITKVPKFDGEIDGKENTDGNMSNATIALLDKKDNLYIDCNVTIDFHAKCTKNMKRMGYLSRKNIEEGPFGLGKVYTQVFELGEIVIVNDYGREIVGKGRKPDKWWVEFKEFDKIEDAIKCSLKITGTYPE